MTFGMLRMAFGGILRLPAGRLRIVASSRHIGAPCGRMPPRKTYTPRCSDCGQLFATHFPTTRRCDSCHEVRLRATRPLNNPTHGPVAGLSRSVRCCTCGHLFERGKARISLCPACRSIKAANARVACGKCGQSFERPTARNKTCPTCKEVLSARRAVNCEVCRKVLDGTHRSARFCNQCKADRVRECRRRSKARRREQIRTYMAAWREANRDHDRLTRRAWKEANRGHVRKYKREYEGRVRVDPRVKMVSTIRSRVATAISAAKKKGRKVTERGAMRYVGCSIEHLMSHLESQFTEGMTWETFGRGGWHIDHVFPIGKADLCDPVELRAVFHWMNCRPIWETDNYAKSATVLTHAQALFNEIKKVVRSGLK
jgi:hypothetical protein